MGEDITTQPQPQPQTQPKGKKPSSTHKKSSEKATSYRGDEPRGTSYSSNTAIHTNSKSITYNSYPARIVTPESMNPY
jgi:hypothetical protein